MPGEEWLWLFSLNRRALYAQDVSNVAALPDGARYQFRYRRSWVGTGARAAWEQDALKDKPALVVFSFQHSIHFHPPAFIPVRAARILESRIVGSFFIVEFVVGEHSTLPAHSRREGDGLPTMGRRVQTFSRSVEKLLDEGHPGGETDRSAVLGEPAGEGLAVNPPPEEAWERNIEHLAGSGAFRRHLFFRVVKVVEVGGAAVPLEDCRYDLIAGKTYELHIAHYQPEPFDSQRQLIVVVDEDVLAVQGSHALAVTSGYDAVRVRFHAVYRDEPTDTTLTIEPATGEDGSRVALDVRVTPPKGEKAFRVSVGTVAVLAVAIPGAWRDFGGDGRMAAVTVIAAGGLLTAWLTNRSRIRLPRK